jgi:uncharacterized protein
LVAFVEPGGERAPEVPRSLRGLLVVPALVIAEAAHLIAARAGARAESAFLADLAMGEFVVEAPAPSDWERIAELVAPHPDTRLGTVDASVVAAAERLGIACVATLDRRRFSAVRPRHVEAFELPLLV